MDQRLKIEERANYALEAVENAKEKVEKQVNKNYLTRIKEIVEEIVKGKYENLHELKGIVASGAPEASGPDNDIFSLDVRGGGVKLPLQSFLQGLIEEVENYLKEMEK